MHQQNNAHQAVLVWSSRSMRAAVIESAAAFCESLASYAHQPLQRREQCSGRHRQTCKQALSRAILMENSPFSLEQEALMRFCAVWLIAHEERRINLLVS
jgi:hypothetical protein